MSGRHVQPKARIAATLLGLLLVAACGGASQGGPQKPADRVHVAVIEGTQLFPVQVMQQKGIASRHGLSLDVTRVASPQALYTQMQAGELDAAFSAWITTALLRQQGTRVTNAYSMYGFTNDVMVTTGSPLQGFADLKGKRIGLFAGPTGGTTILFRLICVKYFGFDPIKDSKVQYGAAPLLVAALKRGDLDAVQILDPQIVQELVGGELRSIGNIGDIWRQRTGQNPMLVSVSLNESWAAAHTDVARRFVTAFKESLDYMKQHDDVWPGLASSVRISGSQGVTLLKRRVAGYFITRWDRAFIDEQLAYAGEVIRTLGSVEGIPTQIPDGTFTTAYAPGG
jgi:NitT/TauT family transport system substrate-binding protein